MGLLSTDIVLDSEAFTTAATVLQGLVKRATELKSKLTTMYENVSIAIDTDAGHTVQLEAQETLIEPVDNLILILTEVSGTLNEVIGTNYYDGIFVQYKQLQNN